MLEIKMVDTEWRGGKSVGSLIYLDGKISHDTDIKSDVEQWLEKNIDLHFVNQGGSVVPPPITFLLKTNEEEKEVGMIGNQSVGAAAMTLEDKAFDMLDDSELNQSYVEEAWW